jgi:hypothetical protein
MWMAEEAAVGKGNSFPTSVLDDDIVLIQLLLLLLDEVLAGAATALLRSEASIHAPLVRGHLHLGDQHPLQREGRGGASPRSAGEGEEREREVTGEEEPVTARGRGTGEREVAGWCGV